ncbi:aminopeptidase N protein, partial [Danaus plexippus plexippus]
KERSAFIWDEFDKSVPMSSYLVAFVVSKYSYKSAPNTSNTKFRIWARSDDIEQTSYSCKVGPAVLSQFERWFNVSFPLPKQDMVAIPDFDAEGMENWGLVTYEDAALLYHDRESSLSDKERIASLIAHELAHQWFGNLVTMKSWSDLWLNEGFATFVASLGVNAIEPTWHADINNAVENTLTVFNLDVLESSHPVSVPLEDPRDITEIFDDISYSKGATLIRMMEMFLGEEDFRQALHNYLIKYSYSNAAQDDLWSELNAVVMNKGVLNRNMTVKRVMDTWTKQTGFPLLTVNRNYSDKSVNISQKRYVWRQEILSPQGWWIPLSMKCERGTGDQKLLWLSDEEGVLVEKRLEHGCGQNEWLLFNYNMMVHIFDDISYSKGATLIRMMEMFLGEEDFRQALHNYLIKYSYSNAAQDDLWSELNAVVMNKGVLNRNMTVKRVMDTWTKQTGFPLLTVNRNYSDKSVNISQKRYVWRQEILSPQGWWIPLSMKCERGTGDQKLLWLSDEEGVLVEKRLEHGCGQNEWLLFNYNMMAPFRVNYDDNNWKLLINTLTSDQYTLIPVEGRVQLLSDAFELAWNNQLDYGMTLQLASYLQKEQEYLPLYAGLSGLSKISNVLKRSAEYGVFQEYVRILITRIYQSGGLAHKNIVNGADLNGVKIQGLSSSWACSMNVPGCEDNALEMFHQWMKIQNPDENNPIPVDLRSIVTCVGIHRGSEYHWSWSLERRKHSNVAASREHLLNSLACSRDVWILAQYLEWTLTESDELHRQESSRVISEVVSSEVGYYVARDFIYNRIKDIYTAFYDQSEGIADIMKSLLGQFTSQKELDEFLSWQKKNDELLSDSKMAVAQGIETARNNIRWVETMKPIFMDRLKEVIRSSSSTSV